MSCYQIKNGFVSISETSFLCPYCLKEYDDSDDKYLKILNKNKHGITRIKCRCGNKFGLIASYYNTLESFTLDKN